MSYAVEKLIYILYSLKHYFEQKYCGYCSVSKLRYQRMRFDTVT